MRVGIKRRSRGEVQQKDGEYNMDKQQKQIIKSVSEVTNHHLFTYNEVREKLIQVFGKPKTDSEHSFISLLTRRIWNRMPKFPIDKEMHKEIHNGK